MADQNPTDQPGTSTVVTKGVRVGRDWHQYICLGDNNTSNKSHTNICFDLTDSVKSFCGRSREIEELHEAFQSNNIIVIQGIGGIGKSEMVRKYAWSYKKKTWLHMYAKVFKKQKDNSYDYILWIKSGSSQFLKASFERLAAKLDIKIENKELTDIVTDIYECIKVSTLIIFDNANSVMEVRKYFPPEKKTNFKLLITSQLTEWGDITFINLEVLTENDSIALVSNIIDCDKNFNSEKENVKTLVNKLQYFPLALQQASAYIKDKKTCENNGYTIEKYLESFEKCLLDPNLEEPFPDYFPNTYEKTIYKTIVMAIEKIERFPLAIDILSCIVYYNAEDIQTNMFSSLDNDLKQEDVDDAVRVLKKYSIVQKKKMGRNKNRSIKSGFGLLHINQLVQQICRKHLERTEKHTVYIQKALGLVIDRDWSYNNHLLTVLKYASETVIHNCYINHLKNVKNDIVGLLASVGCTINSISDLSSLYFSVYFNNRLILKALIDKGAEVNSKTNNGLTPLHLAVICGNDEAIQELINHSANVNMKTNQNQTALYFAALGDHWWAAQTLNFASAEVDVLCDGKTPLHIASERGYELTIRFLCAGKANINAKSRDGLTPLHLASIGGHNSAVQELLENNADVGAVTSEGRTALHLAAMEGFSLIVAEICSKGCDVNARDHSNCTSAELATSFGHLKTAKLLELAEELIKTGKEKCIMTEMQRKQNKYIEKKKI